MVGKLYVVGTPIGNLADLSARALEILGRVDAILAEDTRHTGILLQHFGLRVPMVSYHKFNEAKRREEILGRLSAGQQLALVSDAGMPGISDPGQRIIDDCLRQGVAVEVIPGPSAVIHALVASGFSSTPFYFGGFFPVKSGGRVIEATSSLARDCTSVYFESPHRIIRTLEAFAALDAERRLCLARELTKKFEEVTTGTPGDILAHYAGRTVKGEICLVIEGC
ncbi:MAG: 16S rRNA (cytidine(1402)-2'-O)-methyltransferase [Candidatus Methylacidiphilales bacterium]